MGEWKIMRLLRFMPLKEDKQANPLHKRVFRLVCLFPIQVIASLFCFFIIVVRYYFCKLFFKPKKYKYEVSVCAIFMNEGRFLREWVEYHKVIGVSHMYLYNNNSTDNFREVLAPYIESGFVTLYDWPEKYAQLKIYKDCWEKHKYDTHWLGFIDIDEFVNLQKDDNITDFLSHFKKYPCVYLLWREFGTSGLMKEDDRLVIERFTSTFNKLQFAGKSFINNEYSSFFFTVHCYHAYIAGKLPVFAVTDGKRFVYRTEIFFPYIPYKPKAYLNHYWSKSVEWFNYKNFIRDDVASEKLIKLKRREGIFESHEILNVTKDYSIQRFMALVKKNM